MYKATSMKQTAPRLGLAWKSAGLAALAALTLTACASETEPADPATQGAAEEPDTETTTDDDTAATDDETADTDADAGNAASAAGPVEPGDALETVTYEIPTEDIDGTITVGFHHLQVDENTMELLLTFTPEFEQDEAYTLWQLHSQDHSQVAPALYDRDNLKRYDILRSGGGWDTGNVWASGQHVIELASGDTQAYWANYAVPEDDIDTISVGIPNAPEIKDVEIAWDSADSETTEDDA